MTCVKTLFAARGGLEEVFLVAFLLMIIQLVPRCDMKRWSQACLRVCMVGWTHHESVAAWWMEHCLYGLIKESSIVCIMLTEKWKMWTLNVGPSRVWMAMTGYNTIQWDIFASKDPMQYYKHVRAPYRIHVDSLEASEPWAIALLLLNVFLINRQWIISKECIILLIFANKRHYVRSTPCPKPVKETAIDGMKDWRHLSSGLQKRTVPIYAIMIPPTRGQSAWGQSLFQEANRPVRTLSVPGLLHFYSLNIRQKTKARWLFF